MKYVLVLVMIAGFATATSASCSKRLPQSLISSGVTKIACDTACVRDCRARQNTGGNCRSRCGC